MIVRDQEEAPLTMTETTLFLPGLSPVSGKTSNNAAEREIRAVALGRKNWTFAGSDAGGRRAAAIYTLIQTARLTDVDPQAWLADCESPKT
jgi:hypothetical protein